MLCRLTIRDFVLVEQLELDFAGGFGTLTGETGAGKSILVDALAFALGERADSGLIRAGAARSEVSAEFALDDAPATAEWLAANDLGAAGSLLLRRVVDSNGRSRAYLNGSPVTVQQLREAAETLVDIHGQHAHQSLLRGEAQRALLDGHARLDPLVAEVSQAWRAWRAAKAALDAAQGSAEALIAEREQLGWQIRELETLGFSPDEWLLLNDEHKRLAHAASLIEGAQASLQVLAESDAACEAQVAGAASRISELADYDPALSDVAVLLQSAQTNLREAISLLRRYADRVELDPQRLSDIERRIEAVLACARKFRCSPEDLPGLLGRWQERFAALGEAVDVAGLAERLAATRTTYEDRAQRLSAGRSRAAETLAGEVSQVMQQLALAGGRFQVALLPVDGGSASGFEQIEFRVGGLAGSEARPLAKVVSGGELSRISLAIQVVTSQAASVPTLIFDEVDVGIGGGVAEVVGRLLRELGAQRQVLCVTHLPQVAARANWQWQVSKRADGAQARSQVTLLEGSARIEEIARMLGGVEITAITRQHAREMLGLG
ncbi:MAG TPA: DNA repair protein RecN [Accumulibacter sp.]|uniref:DNA repair protein RecN n=1 Tax=Accumulibacter sp. TaxID=2053492 RepID=UPI002879C768|nr:DNA repair protein RecN [Accumulibacter sp.]MDS4056867.1 DNA repair protein RecN [Accumulibacter sp.]HMV05649.1 DNA repair protein RecN [Accumulibacter sp.]HMW64906.1 DNA repair protein RecN [Accumulibacter sp.]HMW81515.1 DNA repair protein RecN [Accumulibacter sp.]HNB69113.1 DNA repair protein RecN [Accumulibacter sp.]